MQPRMRVTLAFAILLSGLLLLPFVDLPADAIAWQRFVGAYDDVVTVTRAEWRTQDNELRVRAVSSNNGVAALGAYRIDNSYIGPLLFEGSDYRNEFPLPSNPQVITVRSSLGGETTVLVNDSGDPPITVTPSSTPIGGPSATPTSTPVPPTATQTATPVPPTVTSTATPVTATPTATATATPTATPQPPVASDTYLPLMRR